MTSYVYLNDSFVKKELAMVSVFDHGYLYGDGIFETMRSYDGTIFKVEDHIDRLFRSAKLVSLDIDISKDEIINLLYQSLKINDLKNAYIRASLSRGVGEIGLDPDLCEKPNLVIISKKFDGYSRDFYEKGITAAIVNVKRNIKDALNPMIKSTNFLNNILAKTEAKKVGAFEGIMLNSDGYIAEGTVSNIFIVKDGVLKTPSVDTGILDGITRNIVIALAKHEGIEVKECLLTVDELNDSDELFLTNTTFEIMPVTKIREIKIGNGLPGAITKRLLEDLRKNIMDLTISRKEPSRFYECRNR